MYDRYPQEKLAVKGNIAEVWKCYYYPSGTHPKISSYKYFIGLEKKLLGLESGWEEIPFIENKIAEWFESIESPDVNYGYNLLDLFCWEHLMGSWQSQSELEWDIVQEVFCPFNNRELLDIALSVKPKYRCRPHYSFFGKSIEFMWEEVSKMPINGPIVGPIGHIKRALINLLIVSGIFDRIYGKLLFKKK